MEQALAEGRPPADPATAAVTVEAALICERLTKRFGDRTVLADFSARLQPGDFVVLLGPNGAGKSTLFQILAGLYTADGGSIRVAGVDLAEASRWPQALAHMGVVFQQSALDLDLSVTANLRFHAALHGLSRAQADARIEEMLIRFELAERAGDRCRDLSGGMRRKVELVRALLTAPALLLMDEATVGLDPASRIRLLADVRQACRDTGTAVLWATHLTDEAAHADRIIVLDRGAVRFDGSAAQLLAARAVDSVEAAFIDMTQTTKGDKPP